MAVVEVKNLWGGWSKRLDEKGNSSYERRLMVICDDKADGPEVASVAAGVPVIGEQYVIGNDAAAAFCRGLRVQANGGDHEHKRSFYITAEYSTEFDPARNNPNPLLRPGIPKWSGNKYELVAGKQIDGKPIANSFGYKFDDPVMRRFSTTVLSYTRNEASFPIAQAMQYRDKINTDAFLGAEPYQVMVQDLTADYVFSNGINYYEVTWVLEFREDGWREMVENTSFWYRTNTDAASVRRPWPDAKPVTIVNSTNPSENGVYKPPDAVLEDKHFVTLKIQGEVSFAPLNIVLP